MADIALITANKAEVVQSFEQLTAPAIEAIVAGAPVRIDTATGKFTNANATTLAEAKAYGLAVRTVAAGEALTAVRRGILAGFDLSGLNFDALLYLSNTDGRIADVNGTITSIMGRVIPGFAVSTGITADKLLYVDFASAQGASILAENRVLIFSELLAASVDKHVFIADRPYEVVLIKEIHSVVGGAVAAVRPRKILAASTAAPDRKQAHHPLGAGRRLPAVSGQQ